MSVPDRVLSSPSRQAYAIPRPALRSVRPHDPDETLPLLPRPASQAAETLGMRCLGCQGPVQRSTTRVSIEQEGCRLAWDAVPAWVCSRCGSSYFEPQEVQRIRQAVRAVRSLAR
ncbi:MAG TPA: YgiT-type zinc finger protein [Thermoanaerobaculia bacterium]